jgi:AcrR family transcriptional regulator
VTVRARPYHSRLRDEQARATRRRIVAAGGELFLERGYGSATIDAIAERAEVSRKTVFTSVGGKAALLKLAFDWALAGDDEPVAVADRPEVQRMMQGQDPVVYLDEWIAMNAAIAGRLAPLHHVLVVAADSDPEAAALLSTVEDQRAGGARSVAGHLHDLGGLRSDLDVERAAAIIELLMDPLPYRRLVQLHGWTTAEYTEYLRRTAAALLLPPSAGSSAGLAAPQRNPAVVSDPLSRAQE